MKKIVIIDDNKQITSMVRNLLKKEGFLVIQANSGAVGIEKVKDEMPDLVLLDIMMPGMDGWEVCSELKGDRKTKKIPVVFLTAKADEISKSMGKKGADAYIEKPFEINELVKVINKLI